jgi:uncharacterized membrane protein (TIGR02234 family)
MAEPGRTYVPVVGGGLAAATLGAIGSSRGLVTLTSEGAGSRLGLDLDGGQLPLATTLSMVVLAAWGVILVTRRRLRLGVAVVGALAALGVLVTVVAGWWLVPDALREDASVVGLARVSTSPSGWYWLTLLAAVLSAAASTAAVVLVRGWPEMGARYDRPSGASARSADDEDDVDDDLAFWKALDEGRDPTA